MVVKLGKRIPELFGDEASWRLVNCTEEAEASKAMWREVDSGSGVPCVRGYREKVVR